MCTIFYFLWYFCKIFISFRLVIYIFLYFVLKRNIFLIIDPWRGLTPVNIFRYDVHPKSVFFSSISKNYHRTYLNKSPKRLLRQLCLHIIYNFIRLWWSSRTSTDEKITYYSMEVVEDLPPQKLLICIIWINILMSFDTKLCDIP